MIPWNPEATAHGEVVTITYPAQTRRRRWCGYCQSWTWEGAIGVFRHGRGHRARCEREKRRVGAK